MPAITSFPAYADALAILTSHEESFDWLYSNYIKIQVNDIVNRTNDPNDAMSFAPFTSSFFCDFDTRRQANVIGDNFFLGGERCPFLSIFEIPTQFIDKIASNFCDFVRMAVDNDYYIFGYFDVSQIEVYRQNNIHDLFGHQFMIHGYDNDEKCIFFADFLDKGKFRLAKCSYSQIDAAYTNMSELVIPLIKSIVAIKYNEQGFYTFDILHIKEQIASYITPNLHIAKLQNDYTLTMFTPVGWETETYMGVDIYDYLVNFIYKALDLQKTSIDLHHFHAMFDHKNMMLRRVDYFVQKGYLPRDVIVLNRRYKSDVRDKVLMARNLVIKYNLKPDLRIIKVISALLSEAREQEILLLKKIYNIE
jgi:hypothetical protein